MAQEITVEALIEELRQYEGLGLKVRFAHQPSYPFILAIREKTVEDDGVVYLAEDSQFGHASRALTEELGWR